MLARLIRLTTATSTGAVLALGYPKLAHVEDGTPYAHNSSIERWTQIRGRLRPFSASWPLDSTRSPLVREVHTSSYPANFPASEDRFQAATVGVDAAFGDLVQTFATQDDGEESSTSTSASTAEPTPASFLFGVFDGHSGAAAAEFCERRLLPMVRSDLATHGQLRAEAFVRADETFLDECWAEKRYVDGLSGACYVVAHVDAVKEQVTVAHAGDCRAIVGTRSKAGTARDMVGLRSGRRFLAKQLTRDHQIDCHEGEKRRLIAEHPGEPDIINRNRVKGRLQPTRGLGDGKYKRQEYFELLPKMVKRYRKTGWTPPYTTARPDITTYKLDRANDAFLVLATDGAFDEASSQDIVDAVGEYVRAHTPGATDVTKAMQHSFASEGPVVASLRENAKSLVQHFGGAVFEDDESAGRYVATMLDIPRDRRRRSHDDITVLVVLFNDKD